MEVDPHADDRARDAVYALWTREYALGKQGRFAAQLACVDDLQLRYAASADPQVRAIAVRTLSGRVYAALATDDRLLAAGTTRWLSEALERETSPEVRLALAETSLEISAMIGLAAVGTTGRLATVILAPLGRWSSLRGRARIKGAYERRRRMFEAVALAEWLIDEFADSPEDGVRSVAIQAIILAGAIDTLLGRWQRARTQFALVFEDDGTRLGTVVDLITPGRCTATEYAAALAAKAHPATRAKAEAVLRADHRPPSCACPAGCAPTTGSNHAAAEGRHDTAAGSGAPYRGDSAIKRDRSRGVGQRRL